MSMVMPAMKILYYRYPDPIPFNEIVTQCRKDAEGVREALDWMRICVYAMRVLENCWVITDQGREYYELKSPGT